MSMPVIKGWCPGAWRPMQSGDGFVVRISPPLGRLEPAQAHTVARLARTYGNGLIDLSARANLQLRGVRLEAHPALLAELASAGLLDRDAAQDARRTIVLTPFWQASEAAPRLWQSLTTALAADDAPELPAKFGFAIEGSEGPVLRAVSADIRIEADGNDTVLVAADGADFGMRTNLGSAAEVAVDLARWFLESGGAPEGRGRMRRHLAQGARLPARFLEVPCRKPAAQATVKPGPVASGFAVALAFGQMQAATLSALAAVGPLRLTPWRMLVIEGALTVPSIDDLIVDAEDPLLRVVACTGAPGCLQAHQPTRPLARALAKAIPAGSLLHVSGCAKGCANPGNASLTLTATPKGFTLIRNGTAADAPWLTDLPPDASHIQKVL